MTGDWRQFLAAIFLIAFFPAASSADEELLGIDPSLIIEQFDVFGDGDFLLVPVNVFGKTRQFFADTGSKWLVFDDPLRRTLGPPQETRTVRTLTAKKSVDFFAAPPARLGNLDLQTKAPVGCFDLAEVREWSGHDVEGVVGMAFLRRFIVHLDFVAGKLSFLKEVPKDAGERCRFLWEDGTPRIRGQVQGADAQFFEIDTGFRGGACLGSTLFETLSKRGPLAPSGRGSVMGASGRTDVQKGCLSGLSLGNMKLVQVPVIALPKDQSHLLGSIVWSRFTVTFNFPERVLYLKPNRNFHQPFQEDIDGMTIIRKDGSTVVRSLGSSGPAAKAGIQRGDRLLGIDGTDATETRLFTLRQTLNVPGATVHVKLKRGDEIIEVDVKLPENKTEKAEEAPEPAAVRTSASFEGIQQ